jgi:hypothetical protein
VPSSEILAIEVSDPAPQVKAARFACPAAVHGALDDDPRSGSVPAGGDRRETQRSRRVQLIRRGSWSGGTPRLPRLGDEKHCFGSGESSGHHVWEGDPTAYVDDVEECLSPSQADFLSQARVDLAAPSLGTEDPERLAIQGPTRYSDGNKRCRRTVNR